MRTALRSSGTKDGSRRGSPSPHQVHIARGNVHQPAQRPQTSDRGDPPMNSPDSSAMTDAWAGPPQAGQAAPVHSSLDGVAIAARAPSRMGPPATRTQNPSTGSGPAGSSSHASTNPSRSSAAPSVKAIPPATNGAGSSVPSPL